MNYICPNCGGNVKMERPLEVYVTCNECNTELTKVGKYSKLDYIEAIMEKLEGTTIDELSVELGFSVRGLIKTIVKTDIYQEHTYYRIRKIIGNGLDSKFELIELSEYGNYRETILENNNIALEWFEDTKNI